jgi:hypothetical protein
VESSDRFELPEIFVEFRDGFDAWELHNRCDGHKNTLTVILAPDGLIFGGFTRAEWESGNCGKYKADPSLKSFLFTFKHPDNVPVRRFALKAERKWAAIYCDSDSGPHFCDIYVSRNCNINTSN